MQSCNCLSEVFERFVCIIRDRFMSFGIYLTDAISHTRNFMAKNEGKMREKKNFEKKIKKLERKERI